MMSELHNCTLKTITMPIRALLGGANFSLKVDKVEEDALLYALPASRPQKRVGEMLFVEGKPVVTLEGPPGMSRVRSDKSAFRQI